MLRRVHVEVGSFTRTLSVTGRFVTGRFVTGLLARGHAQWSGHHRVHSVGVLFRQAISFG